jgi:uncharacterized protein YceK
MKIIRVFFTFLLLAMLVLVLLNGCASIPRKTTFINTKTGEVCYGGFNLWKRTGWVTLPDGTKLTGKTFGAKNADYTSLNFNGTNTESGSFSGSGSSFSAVAEGEGFALLRSDDGKELMEIHVMSNRSATAGYGEAKMNDGREFRVIW